MTHKLIPMTQFVLEIDWLTTKEFCDNYKLPHPFFVPDNTKASADQFLSLDVIKQKMFVEYAKLLNKPITDKILLENFGFEAVDVRGGSPKFKTRKYTITKDTFGYFLEPYDSVDGARVCTIEEVEVKATVSKVVIPESE